MKYDFDELVDRRGTNSYKWDSCADSDVIPLWVADMDFKTAPVIVEALQKRVSHAIFGYTKVPETYFKSVVEWFKKRHGWNFSEDWIIYTSGVVPAISAVIKAMTTPGDKVIVQTPVYNCFFSSIINNDCEVYANPLKYENGIYTIDFDDLELKASDPQAKLLLLCNPHNPAGRVWTTDELARIGEICSRHNVVVVADEIHCEFVFPGHKYTPYASVNESTKQNSIVCNAPSKAFNTAGLQIANIITPNSLWRKKIDKAININEVCDVNPFGVEALIAAYSEEGAEWLQQLNSYLFSNYNLLRRFFDENLPFLPVTSLEGTYLVWINCSAIKKRSSEICDYLLEKYKVWVNSGDMYGDDSFIRINLACPKQRLEEGLSRIAKGMKELAGKA